MANAANLKNIRNSKSRQYAEDRKRFGGTRASTPSKPDYSDKTLRSSSDTSGQPKSYSSESAPSKKTSRPDYSDKSLRSSADSSGQPKSYSAESAPSKASSKIPGIKDATSKLGAKAGSKIAGAARLAGRASGIGMLLEPSELSGDETPYKGVKDSYTATSARDRAADILGQPRSKATTSEPSKAETPAPSTPAKKSEAPVAVVKKQTTVVSKPKAPTEGQKARDQIARMRDIYNTDPEFTSSEDENAYTKSVAGEDSEYKRGGQIKRRPPKPAKKAPAKRFASGGMSRSSASKRGDGCATKGHTKGKYL